MWLLEPHAVWDKLQRVGNLYNDGDLDIISSMFPIQSEWMRYQMQTRVPGYEGRQPWWAWVKPMPDLRRWFSRGDQRELMVRIEIEVARERTVLVNASAWGEALNFAFLGPYNSEIQAEVFENVRYRRNAFDALPSEYKAEMMSSWEHIFDLEGVLTISDYSDAVLGTIETLHLSDVKRVTKYYSRPPK